MSESGSRHEFGSNGASGGRNVECARFLYDDRSQRVLPQMEHKIEGQQRFHPVRRRRTRSAGRNWQIEDEPGLAGGRRHTKPVRDNGLKSRAFGTKTGGTSRFLGRIGEAGPGLELQRLAWSRPTGYDITARNTEQVALETLDA